MGSTNNRLTRSQRRGGRAVRMFRSFNRCLPRLFVLVLRARSTRTRNRRYGIEFEYEYEYHFIEYEYDEIRYEARAIV